MRRAIVAAVAAALLAGSGGTALAVRDINRNNANPDCDRNRNSNNRRADFNGRNRQRITCNPRNRSFVGAGGDP